MCEYYKHVSQGSYNFTVLPPFGQNEELSQANIRIGLLEKRLENINKEVRVVLFPWILFFWFW